MEAEILDEAAATSPVASVVEGGIAVSFSEFYKRNITDYDYFPMTRKRNFLNMAHRAAENLNALLRDFQFSAGLLSLRFDISLPEEDPEFVSEAEFPARLHDLFDQSVCARIRESVAESYAMEAVDIDTDHAGKNEELQFTNEHAKMILQWSFACLAASPLVTAFMEERDIEAKEGSPLLMDCFSTLLRRFEPPGETVDILAKLRKLVESRVMQTKYTDKVMWNYLRNIATDPYLYADRLFRKFVVEGVPKLEQGTNIVRFFHAFLRLQIKYQFTAKFGMQYKPVRHDVMNDEGMSAMEHLETELIRRDEGAAVLGEVNVACAIRDSAAELEEPPTDEEVEHWAGQMMATDINAWQRGMVTKFFLPRVGRVEVVKTRTLADYARMMLITRRWLTENNFPCLAAYMGCRITEGADGRRLISRKKFVRDFMDSAQYQELLGGCYALANQALVDSGVIIDMISAVHVSVFERLPELGEEPSGTPQRVDHRIEAVAQEVLRFVSFVSRPPA